MAERKRSTDGTRETEEYLNEVDKDPISHQGRSGGSLGGKVGTRDELKRVEERPAGKTRVEGGDERHSGMKKEDI